MNEWETCSERLAHINFDTDQIATNYFLWNYYVSQEANTDFSNKRVLDWGCGGGVFADWLRSHYNYKSYTAVDISQRSINECKKHINGDFYLLPELPEPNFDILVCFAVIQHMTMEQYWSFKHYVENSEIPELIIQTRHGSNYDPDNLIYRLRLPGISFEGYKREYKSEIISSNHYQYWKFKKL